MKNMSKLLAVGLLFVSISVSAAPADQGYKNCAPQGFDFSQVNSPICTIRLDRGWLTSDAILTCEQTSYILSQDCRINYNANHAYSTAYGNYANEHEMLVDAVSAAMKAGFKILNMAESTADLVRQ